MRAPYLEDCKACRGRGETVVRDPGQALGEVDPCDECDGTGQVPAPHVTSTKVRQP